MFSGIRSMELRQSCRKSNTRFPKVFRSKHKKIINPQILRKKNYLQKYSSGRVDCSLRNPADFFSLKISTFFTIYEFFSKTCSPKLIIWTNRRHLSQSRRKRFLSGRKTSADCSKTKLKYIFFRKKIFLKIDSLGR